MKFFKMAAVALSLSFSAAAFASAPVADCSEVAKEAKKVCESYNVLRYAVKGYYQELKSEERDLEATRTYWNACKLLYRAVANQEGTTIVENRLRKVYSKDNAMVSQLTFLARFHEKYKQHKDDILWDKQEFEDQVIEFLSSEDDEDDFEDDNEADDI